MYGVTIIGNLTQMPELRFTNGGKAMMNFSLAVNRKDRNGTESVDFHRCVAWGELAEHLALLDKGCRVMCYGRLSTRTYEHEGVKKTVTELVCDDAGPSARWAEVTATKVGKPNYQDRTADAMSVADAAEAVVANYKPNPEQVAYAKDEVAAARGALKKQPPAAPVRTLPPEPTEWSEDPF